MKCSLMCDTLIAYDNFLSARYSAFNHFEFYLVFFLPEIIIDAFSLVTDRLAKKQMIGKSLGSGGLMN